MAKMTGFFDLAGSVRYLLYGIVSGMILASAVDRLILAGIVESSLNIASASVLALLLSLIHISEPTRPERSRMPSSA